MKNLILQSERHFYLPEALRDKFQSDTGVDFASLQATLADSFHGEYPNHFTSNDNSLILVLQANGWLTYHIESEENQETTNLIHGQVDLNSVLDEREETGWWSVQVLLERNVACCLNRTNGAIVTVQLSSLTSTSSQESPEVELVGEFENGILAAAWSPDGQVLALVVNQEDDDDDDDVEEGEEQAPNTQASEQHNMLLTMTNQFEVLSEVILDSFAKSAEKQEFVVSLRWRPDCSSLAVLSSASKSDETNRPDFGLVLRIFEPTDLSSSPPALGRTEDGSGKLLKNFAAPVMAWAGADCSLLLATVQSTGSKTKICFVESNGLAHGGFVLRDKKCIVHQMEFAPGIGGSNMLAVHLTTLDQNEKIQLWHRSNYHWYLKQEIRVKASTPPSQSIATLAWSKFSQEDHLTVLLKNGTRQSYSFLWHECVAFKENTVLVVDGCDLLLTPLAKALVPPPMAAATLTFEAPVRNISLAPLQGNKTSVVALLHLSDDSLVVLGEDESSTTISQMIARYTVPSVLAKFGPIELRTIFQEQLGSYSSLYKFHSLLMTSIRFQSGEENQSIAMDCICVEIDGQVSSKDHIIEMTILFSSELDVASKSAIRVEQINRIQIEHGRILALSPWYHEDETTSSHDGAIVSLNDGQLLEYTRAAGENCGKIHDGRIESLLEPCPFLFGLRRRSDGGEEHRIIGMSWRKRLYCGEVLLADSISSFTTSDRFLCYITAAASLCQLKFIAKSQLWALDPLMGGSEENAFVVSAQHEPRNVERGSRIVTVCHSKPLAVLQLPRGNLEGVVPRALVLPHILEQLVRGNYKSALEIMRQQKVDLNLLVDWNPASFLSNGAEDLLHQVSNVDHLNLFISSLRNENVTQTTHPLPSWLLEDFGLSHTDTKDFDFSTKINQVCWHLRSLMTREVQVGEDRLLPVLSTFAKEEPPKLEAALSLIQTKASAQQANGTSKKTPPLFSDRVQSAIQYLAFLATYDMLFDTALGMYDLDLARAVARNSQMDPKTYLPLLKKYRELPQLYARHEIDLRLNRYEQALRNLVRSLVEKESCPEWEANEFSVSFDSCLSLVKKHKLHRLGLELFQDEEQQREILLDLGEHLLASREADNALTIFLSISQPAPVEQILKASKTCQDWRTYFTYAVTDEEKSVNSKYGISPLVGKARDIAEELVGSAVAADFLKRRLVLADAARIMLDYGQDPGEAVDIMIQGELWSEAQRIARLNDRTDLERKCIESCVSRASLFMDDMSERRETFVATMERYIEVLRLRKEAYARGEDLPPSADQDDADDSGSLFSAASQASHLSGMSSASRGSTGSTGSSASLSTVISVQSKSSSFSLAGSDHTNRHKSKYNEIGTKGKQKKKKKKGKGRAKVIPGSEKELEGLVETLQMMSLDSMFSLAVTDCIIFLSRNQNLAVAQTLFSFFQESHNKINQCQENRRSKEREMLLQREEINRREGLREEPVVHPLETKVDAIPCENLPQSLTSLFECFPSSS